MGDNTMEYLLCPECDAPKPVTEFYVDRARKTGRKKYCKIHQRQRAKDGHYKRLKPEVLAVKNKHAHDQMHYAVIKGSLLMLLELLYNGQCIDELDQINNRLQELIRASNPNSKYVK